MLAMETVSPLPDFEARELANYGTRVCSACGFPVYGACLKIAGLTGCLLDAPLTAAADERKTPKP